MCEEVLSQAGHRPRTPGSRKRKNSKQECHEKTHQEHRHQTLRLDEGQRQQSKGRRAAGRAEGRGQRAEGRAGRGQGCAPRGPWDRGRCTSKNTAFAVCIFFPF